MATDPLKTPRSPTDPTPHGGNFEDGPMTDKQLLDRFTSERDEAAFEAIVRRHGPIVLRICRGILDDPHEVDDAFQGTFVVLVKNAVAIRDRDALGPWLYEVAYRVATRARGRFVKRRVEVGGRAVLAISMAESCPGPDPEQRELATLLHDEVRRLPEGCRDAVVSCYLEGNTHEEAAKGLGLPLGTLKGRLRQGRELLRSRLARRGVAVSLALLILLLRVSDAEADVVPSEPLIRSTVDAASTALARKAVRRLVSVPILLAAATLLFSTTMGTYLFAGGVTHLKTRFPRLFAQASGTRARFCEPVQPEVVLPPSVAAPAAVKTEIAAKPK